MLGKKIAHRRKELGLSQYDLAKKLDISQSSVAAWEIGKTTPSGRNLVMLSKLLGVSIDELTGTPNPSALNEKIAFYRKRCGLSQAELAEELGITQGAVAAWESGANTPSSKNLISLASALNTSFGELSGVKAMPARGRSGYVPLKVLGKTHAGDPIEAIEDITEIEIPESVARRHPEAFGLVVEGECMNRRFPNGCVVLVDPCGTLYNGCAVVADIYGDSVLRTYMRGQSYLLLAADSYEEHEDMIFQGDEEVNLVGVVVWYQAPEDFK